MADFEFKAPVNRAPIVRYVLTGGIVLVLLVILIWAIIHHFHKVSTTQPPAKSPSTSQSSGSSKQGSSNSSSGSASSGSSESGSSKSGTTSGQSTQGSSSSQSQQLTNTGPGDVVALFIGATLAGTLGYRVYLRRHMAHS